MRRLLSAAIAAASLLFAEVPALAQVVSIGGVTGTIGIDGSLTIDMDVLGLKGPAQPLGPILDVNTNVGAFSNGHAACMGDTSCMIRGDIIYLQSSNEQIWPGSIGFGGNWQTGETAAIEFAWAGGQVTVSCVVGASCGGVGTNSIAQTLAKAVYDSRELLAGAVYANGSIIPNYPIDQYYGFGFLTTYTTYTTLVVTNRSTTTAGSVTYNRPTNKLDGPTGLLMYRMPVIGNGRLPQAGDYLMSVIWHGPISSDPLNGGYAYVRQDGYIDDPGQPLGRWDLYTMCAGGGGAANGNGCLRAVVRQGLVLPSAADGSYVDHGHGTVSVPGNGGYYLGSVGAMTADPSRNRWIINSSGDIAFSAPNLYNCQRGIKTDGNGVLSCL